LQLTTKPRNKKTDVYVAVNVMRSQVAANVFRSKNILDLDFEKLNNQILSAIAELVSDRALGVRRIVFLSMSTGDTSLGLKLRRLIGDRCPLEILADLDSQYRALSKCDLLIGMRLHTIIMSTQMNVKPLAIAFLPKVTQIMGDLGMTTYVVQGYPFDEGQFTSQFNRLFSDQQNSRGSMTTMSHLVQDLRARADMNAEVARSILKLDHGNMPAS